MTLHEHRGRFERRITPLARWCAARGITPNQISVVGLMLTLGSAVALYLSTPADAWLLVVGGLVLWAGSVLDSADGVLARMTGSATRLGDYLDHAFDRFADVFLLVALSFSTWVPLWVGTLAIVGTLLTSYMGTQAQAVGVGRHYGGLMGRADRLFLLIAAPLVQFVVEVSGYAVPYGANALYLVVAWVALAGNITALQRFWASLRALKEAGEDDDQAGVPHGEPDDGG